MPYIALHENADYKYSRSIERSFYFPGLYKYGTKYSYIDARNCSTAESCHYIQRVRIVLDIPPVEAGCAHHSGRWHYGFPPLGGLATRHRKYDKHPP